MRIIHDQNKSNDEQVGNRAENLDEKSSKIKESEIASIDKEKKSTADTPEENKTGDVYKIDDFIAGGGYGWYQRFVTFLAGMIWFTAAFQTMVLTIIGDFLACDWEIYRWHIAMIVAVVFLCMSVGSPFFGYLGDNYGRKTAFVLYMLIQFGFGAGAAAAKGILSLTILMAFVGFSLGGFGQAVTYVCEFYPAKDRGMAGFYVAYYWNAGQLLFILVSWGLMTAFNNWRWVMLAAALPTSIVLAGITWFPESPRYYLVSQQVEKAQEKLEVMARINKVELPKGRLKSYKKHESKERGHFLNLFQAEHRTSVFLMWYIWFSVTFTYYAYVLLPPIIIRRGMTRLSEDMFADTHVARNNTSIINDSIFLCKKFSHQNYIDFLITTAAEIPGIIVYSYLMTYIKSKILLSSSCLLTMLLTFLMLIDTERKNIIHVLIFVGRANICGIIQMIYIMTTECFPTTLRALALGSSMGIGKVGSAFAPFVIQVIMVKNGIAAICIIGLILLFTAISAACLPREMKGKALKEITKEFKNTSDLNVNQK
ncbi:putative transporter svop-1 [Nephila pilipes]|uniref:Putative transporter svop-1 n=1 Tax=Nephila pilipes TaxID=299642 RepID=A0A8X6QA36_NEPPI|nr:putative transporter svop-1 [Nephila pilipes]